MFFKKEIFGLVCFCLISYTFAQDTTSESDKNTVKKTESVGRSTLFNALESALTNNKEILSAQSELMAIHENHVSAASSFRPEISANAQYRTESTKSWNNYPKPYGTMHRPNTNSREKSYGIGVKQNIFHGFADTAKLRETDIEIKAKWSSYEAIKQSVLRDVSLNYFSLIAKKEEISHLRTLLDARKESLEVAKEMHETGAAKYLDVSQSIASYAETEAALAKAEAEYKALEAQFEELTGFKIPAKLNTPGQLFDENLSEKQALDLAMRNNPEIIAATNALEAAKMAIKTVNTEFVPSVDGSYSFNQSYDHTMKKGGSSESMMRNAKGHSFGLSVSVPIYDGGASRAEKRKLIELATKAAVDRDKKIEEVKAQISAVWAAIKASKQNLISTRKAVEARELALHDTQEEYKAGVKIMYDVLTAQEQLFEAKSYETEAEENYFSNQCKANALIGRMEPRYLKVKDSDFDYKKHFSKTSRKL